MMNSKERMMRAVAREKPDRLPVSIHQWQKYHLDEYMGGMDALEAFRQNGTDVSETLSPPGTGGNIIEPARVRDAFAGQVAMIGGMDQFNILTKGTPGQIRAETRRLFEGFGRDGGYICAASDHFFDTPVANLKAFAEAARDCVY